MRKLGQVDEAIRLYAQALDIDPDYLPAREYLGEAYLSQGQRAAAADQLRQIEQRCGNACSEYLDLAEALEAGEQRATR